MSEESTSGRSHSEDLSSNNCLLQEVLKTCANIPSLESLCPCAPRVSNIDFNDVYICRAANEKMISANPYSFSGFISSNSSYGSEEASTDIVLDEDNRISLAYENLCTIPRQLADKFPVETKFLDLSYNNFQNLKFLSFFEELHTLILDRNVNLDVNTFPYLPNLRILWINNCDICNITDWIHRIERQCPVLEHLSCMGNPGIQTIFRNDGSVMPAAHARDYIFQVLSNLKFLDGVSQMAHSDVNRIRDIRSSRDRLTVVSSSCASMTEHDHESTGTTERASGKGTTTTLSFKNFFRLKPTKKAVTRTGNGNNASIGSSSN